MFSTKALLKIRTGMLLKASTENFAEKLILKMDERYDLFMNMK